MASQIAWPDCKVHITFRTSIHRGVSGPEQTWCALEWQQGRQSKPLPRQVAARARKFPKGHQGRPNLAGLLGAALTLHVRHMGPLYVRTPGACWRGDRDGRGSCSGGLPHGRGRFPWHVGGRSAHGCLPAIASQTITPWAMLLPHRGAS